MAEDLRPNPAQRDLIEHDEGVALVDAGPGTGKTFAVARRYAHLIEREDVEPEDVLLVTFTRTAATEMKDRIVDRTSYPPRDLADAPIRTFHAHCHELLREHGRTVPEHLGIDERFADSTSIVEDRGVERELFRAFIGRFRDEHPEYADEFRAVDDPADLLELIGQLAAKGVLPTADGWYRNGADHLEGDLDALMDRVEDLNRPRNDGAKQSRLRERLVGYGRSKTYQPGAPDRSAVRGGATKRVDPGVIEAAFGEDRAELRAFVHDVYFEYVRYALARNVVTFGFLQMLAFVLLCEEDDLRERQSHRYVMVDEFQDSSEIQFKLALLLSAGSNLLVVGDWKQSIYSFQYAAVENITDFEARLRSFRAALNEDRHRVAVDPDDIARIDLTENYRSTDDILRFAERALATPATANERVDEGVLDGVPRLEANATLEASTIEAVAHEDEVAAVLAKIHDIVDNRDYALPDGSGDRRLPTYGDIAVLTRTHAFGRELMRAAEEHGYPLAYDGGVELFRTDAAKLLLAWLRIAEYDADRGWAVVLEAAGFTLDEIDHLLETRDFPATMVTFRDRLRATDAVGTVARLVVDRYDLADDHADVLVHVVASVHDAGLNTRGDLIRYIERGIEAGSTHDVQTSAGRDSVTVQTIHAAKGLEYPIVIMANMNDGRFPPRGGGPNDVLFRDPIGLRQRKVYAEGRRRPYVFHRWQYDVLRRCLGRGYDEERRLLYVALTRAEQHVCLTAGDSPNAFLQGLPVDVEETDVEVPEPLQREPVQTQLPFAVDPPSGPVHLTPHDLVDEAVFRGEGELDDRPFRGTDFGSRVHDFAEAYATGAAVEPTNESERHVSEFLDGLEGEPLVETEMVLPLEVDGRSVAIVGVIDLVNVRPDRIEVVDYKTDPTRRAHEEYRAQVSVYYHAVDAWFEDRPATASILYTPDGELVRIEPLSMDEIRERVRSAVPG